MVSANTPYSQEYQEDLALFAAEVSELLGTIEENLIELEKSPSETSLVQELFRCMHTIKGGAATLGLQDAVEVTHVLESILDEVRSEKRTLTSELVDVCFAALDWLKEWHAAVTGGSQVPGNQHVLAKLKEYLDSGGASSSSIQKESLVISRSLMDKIEGLIEQGKDVYVLTIRFGRDTPLLSVRCYQLITVLEEAGEVVGSRPSIEDIESDRVSETLEVYIVCDDGCAQAKKIAGSVQGVQSIDVRRYAPEPRPKSAGTQSSSDSSSAETLVPSQTSSTRKTPLGKTVRVDVGLLDFLMNMVGELVIDRTRLSQLASRLLLSKETAAIGSELTSLANRLQRTSAQLQEGIMRARLLPLKNIFSKFPRMVRDLANRCGKEVIFEMSGEDTELDRSVLEAIDDPLIHILRNAIDHGIETPEERIRKGKPREGKVTLSAWHQENNVLVEVADDGAGIDPEKLKRVAVRKGLITQDQAQNLSEKEALELIFMPGFSTAEVATEVSGRGVGMDVVRSNLERVNGHIEMRTELGRGTAFTLKLPLTLAIMRALLVRCGDNVYAVPTSSVEEILAVGAQKIGCVHGRTAMIVRDQVVPLMNLEDALWKQGADSGPGQAQTVHAACKYAVLARVSGQPVAFGVDDLIGEEEVVVKEMGRLLSRVRGVAGATILAQGDPAVILDVNGIVQ